MIEKLVKRSQYSDLNLFLVYYLTVDYGGYHCYFFYLVYWDVEYVLVNHYQVSKFTFLDASELALIFTEVSSVPSVDL
jgi:hypothetical protein